MSTFNVFDTIRVVASVTDDKQLNSVSIRILNSDLVPVLPTVSVSTGSNSVSINQGIPIENIHIVSGTYFVNIFATDGTNDANGYQEITIIEAPLEVKRYVVVSRPGVNIVQVDTISPQFSMGMQAQWSGDHSTTSVNSYHQQTVVGGGKVSASLGIDGSDGGVLWSVINQNTSSLPYFKDVNFSQDHLLTYITNEDGQIRGFTQNGSISFSALADNSYRPLKVLGHEDLVIVELEPIVPPLRRLGFFWRSSGVLWVDHPLDMEIVFMNPRISDRLLIFGNDDNGQAVAEEREIDNGGSWSVANMPTGKLNGAAAISNYTYLLAHEQGLYRYEYATNNVFPLATGFDAKHVEYDRVNGLALVAVNSDLMFYNASTGALATSVGLPDEAEFVGVLYNK